jgi:PAS domain-containing protein
MPLPHVVGLFFGGAVVVLGLAMLLVVIAQAPRRRDNQLMAVYLLTLVIVGASGCGARLASVLGRDPATFMGLASLATGASRLALFWFVTSYAGIQRHAWVRIVRAVGAVTLLVAFWAFQSGNLLADARITPEGLIRARLTAFTAVFAPIGLAVTLASLVCIWAYRRRGTGPLLLGAAIMAVGFLIPLPFAIRGDDMLPVLSTSAAVGSVFFTYAILRESLFGPLQRSEASLAALIETSDDPVWSVDGNLHLTAFNHAAVLMSQRLFTMTPVLGMHALQGLAPEAQLLWRRFYDRALRGERLTVVRHLTTPGLPADVEFTFGPISGGGGVAVVMHDISDHRRVVAEHERAREVAESDSLAKSRLLVKLGEALRARLGGRAEPELLGLLDSVSAIAKVEAEPVRLVERPFALREELGLIAKTQRRAVTVDVAEDVPDAVAGDPTHVGHVIASLVDDDARDPATVRVEREAEMYGAVRVRFEVRGVGEDTPVHGIHHAIAARLVEAMGGRLVVEREAGAPAVAVFSLRFALA